MGFPFGYSNVADASYAWARSAVGALCVFNDEALAGQPQSSADKPLSQRGLNRLVKPKKDPDHVFHDGDAVLKTSAKRSLPTLSLFGMPGRPFLPQLFDEFV
jgi:hypothetical protein